jgi:holo-[acyl-carrier protein] synthase
MPEVIIGLGIDLVSVNRISEIYKRYEFRFLSRLLSVAEIEAQSGKIGFSAQFLAGRWAAKEAVAKALGSGIRGFNMSNIEVFNNELGMPYVNLTAGAEQRASDINASKLILSISHEREMAMAQAIAISFCDH